MVHFTPLQVILNIVIALLAVALPTWVLWIVGSKIPPALTCEGRKSGFAGLPAVLYGDARFLLPLLGHHDGG